MHSATLRLFNGIQVDVKRLDKEISQDILERTIRNGYILDPFIQPDDNLLAVIENIIGISGEKANASFHKSWAIVRDTPMEVLVLQQIVHYLTTYGFKHAGIYKEDSVYIPHEDLELPDIQKDISLVVVKAMTAKELLEKIIELGSGIALSQETLDDIMTIVRANKYDNDFTGQIANRELKATLYSFYGLIPSEPIEFLRHLVSNLTNESLIIKNDFLINKIKESNGQLLDELLEDAPDDLASIFFRFKPLFLAMKSISSNKTFFNQLRKKANILHKPLPPDYMNSITEQIKHGTLDLDVLTRRLEKTAIWRKTRLAYALNYRLHAGESIVYRVRNGRGWATKFEWSSDKEKVTQDALDIVIDSIVHELQKGVSGKTIYIPANIHYSLPATEKQFVGFFPSGTRVTIKADMIIGIHWTNNNYCIDLDLSVIGESGKIGWDSAYRSEDRNVLFSGDMTTAPPPNGATELFYLRHGEQEPKIMFANYFNFRTGGEVETKILVASEKPTDFGNNYMVNVNNIVAQPTLTINKKQNILGLISSNGNEIEFYFFNTSVGTSISSTADEHSTHSRKYLITSLTNSLDFRGILRSAGANVVGEKPDLEYIDLSPEVLDKTTIIDLITGNIE